jgi:hypothetical protein
MAKLTVLKNHKIGDAIYLKDDVIEVFTDEAIILLAQNTGVFAPLDFDPDDKNDKVGARYKLFLEGKLKIAGSTSVKKE